MKQQRNVTVKNDLGLHLRAAGALVRVASSFQSEIWLEHGKDRANAKSIISVLALAAGKGADLKISVEGPDAQEALQAVYNHIEQGFPNL